MKNVGVLTHCVADNYGANLQALSTAAYLKNKGYNPVFIRWEPYPLNNNNEQVRLHSTFLEKQGFEVTSSCESDKDFVDCIINNGLEFIIVGSDCVFTYSSPLFPYSLSRRGFVKKKALKDWVFPNPFWLPFFNQIPNVKAVIMSGSCGASDLKRARGKVKKGMRACLANFSYVSVRDNYTKESLVGIVGAEKAKNLPLTPDPVFSFNTNVKLQPAREEILRKYGLPEKYVVIGFYSNHMPSAIWLSNLKTSLNKRGVSLINLPMPQGGKEFECDINISLPLDSLDWYCLIKYSCGYVGNNMHPIIVAMHNGVPFYSVNAHGKYYLCGKIQSVRNTKEYELLNRFNLLKYHTSFRHVEGVDTEIAADLLTTFDRNYCLSCAKVLQEEYNEMMSNIIDLIKN